MYSKGLVCFDMDGVLVDWLSTWEWVYSKLKISNSESMELYLSGNLTEWKWLIRDLSLIRGALQNNMNDDTLRSLLHDCPLMNGYEECINSLLENNFEVAIISGGMQHTAYKIASIFPSKNNWIRRWGGIDRKISMQEMGGHDSRLHVFCNGWDSNFDGEISHTGRYNVQMNSKDTVVRMLQRRLGVPESRTASVGDSKGDVSMFEVSDFSVAFNPMDEIVGKHSDSCITSKDLRLVSSAILEHFSSK